MVTYTVSQRRKIFFYILTIRRFIYIFVQKNNVWKCLKIYRLIIFKNLGRLVNKYIIWGLCIFCHDLRPLMFTFYCFDKLIFFFFFNYVDPLVLNFLRRKLVLQYYNFLDSNNKNLSLYLITCKSFSREQFTHGISLQRLI